MEFGKGPLGPDNFKRVINPAMVKPYRLTYLAKGGGEVLPSPSLNLNQCFSDLLLIVDLYIHPSSTRTQIKSCQYL